MRHLLAYGHRPGGSRLSASPRTILSRFLTFVQHVHKGRQQRRGERTKAQEEITTRGSALLVMKQLNQPSGQVTLPNSYSARVRFHLMQGKYLHFLPLKLLTCGSPLSSMHTTSNTCQNFVPRFLYFWHTQHCVGILKIAYLFDCASFEDVLCMNVDQHDVNWLLVPFRP